MANGLSTNFQTPTPQYRQPAQSDNFMAAMGRWQPPSTQGAQGMNGVPSWQASQGMQSQGMQSQGMQGMGNPNLFGSPAPTLYPGVGTQITGPQGSISWGGIHDKVTRGAGFDGAFTDHELQNTFGVSPNAARAILQGQPAIPAQAVLDAFKTQAATAAGMPSMITNLGIDTALNGLINAGGPMRGSFPELAPNGFIDKNGFVNLASEALDILGQPGVDSNTLGQMFDWIAGDGKLDAGELNMIAPLSADGSFSMEALGESVANLRNAMPPVTPPAPSFPSFPPAFSAGTPAYPFGPVNEPTMNKFGFDQMVRTASNLTGQFVSQWQKDSAYQNIGGINGVQPGEFTRAFGLNPTPWDVVSGVRNNAAPAWSQPSFPTWSPSPFPTWSPPMQAWNPTPPFSWF